MKLFGYELVVRRAKAGVGATLLPTDSYADGWNYDTVRSGWFPLSRESFAGAWQRGIGQASSQQVVTQGTVWACISLIMSDIGKLPLSTIRRQATGVWSPEDSSAFSPVLRKPNHYQNRIKFFESWVASKLTRGNTYVLKMRDRRGVVGKMFVLDPTRVTPLVSPDGAVYYQLAADNLAGIQQAVTVPASEVIHDVGVALFHPLCGLSPIMACALAAIQSLKIQGNAARFFANNSKPGGVLTAPATISEVTAKRIQENWEANFSGEENIGRVAVLGDGLKYEAMSVNATDAQLVEQLNWSDERICSVFHVPAFKVGVGQMPTHNNVEALNLQYYSQCLQSLIEAIELSLDEGLDLPSDVGVEFDVENGLMRMDSATRIKNAVESIKGVAAPNEARAKLNLPPVPGGEHPYLQQQNYSLEALAKRDAQDDPFRTAPPPAPPPVAAEEPDDDITDEDAKSAATRFKAFLERPAA